MDEPSERPERRVKVSVLAAAHRRLRRPLAPRPTLRRGVAIFVMLVGIGFLTLLIGPVSERLRPGEIEDVAAAEREVAEEVETPNSSWFARIRAIGERLREVESRVERLARR